MSDHIPIRGLNHALNASAAGEHAVRAFCLALPFAANAATVPEWVPVLPAPDSSGRITGEDGRSWFVKDMRALASRVTRKLPIDINHSTELAARTGGESPAVGWMLGAQLEVRADGSLWAMPDWTERGMNALKNREYGFTSPTFDWNKKTGEIVRLVSLGLVNDPNFSELALNRRQAQEDDAMLEQLLAALGLTAAATPETALGAIAKLKGDLQTAINHRDTPSLDRFVPRADYDAAVARATNAESTLATRDLAMFTEECDREITAALTAGKITPATKDYHRANCLRGKPELEAFRKFVATAPVIAPDQIQRGNGNGNGNGGGNTGADGLTENQRAICKRMDIKPEDYAKSLSTQAAA